MNERNHLRADAAQLRKTLFSDPAHRSVLHNGLTVLHREDHAADLVSIQLWIKTGSMHEGAHLGAGLSHYLEHMVFKGTGRREDGQIAREVQECGGTINAYTSFDRTVYYVDLPAEHATFGLDLLADMVFSPRLDAGDAERERGVILREIDMGLDDPDYKLSRALFETAFRSHPYRLPVIGRRDIFGELGLEDLRAYHRQRYVPENAVLVVVGAIEEGSLRAGLEDFFEKLPDRSLAPVLVPAEVEQLARREQRLAADVTVCRGTLAFRIPGLAHADAPALDLLAAGLGHGQSSHLWQRLREEREILHDVSVHAWNPGERGLFWISYLCDPGKRALVEASILAELAVVQEKGLPEAALERARRSALVGEINSRKTTGGQAARLGVAEVVVGDLGYPQAYHERLAEAALKDVQAAARRYLREVNLTAVSLNQADVEQRARPAGHRLVRPRPFEVIEMANGSKLVWQQDRRLPKVHLRLGMLGGAHYEVPEERGITALLATMLTRDTRWRRSSEVAELVENAGGVFEEYCGNNSFGLAVEVLGNDLPLGRSVLQDAVLGPRFQPEVLAREKAGQIASLKERWDDVVDRGHLLLRRHFFGDHPLAIDPDGEVETVEAVTAEALHACFQRLVVSRNAVLTVVGDIDPGRDLPILEAFLQDLPEWAFERREVPFVPGQARRRCEEFAPREQAVVFLAFPDVGVQSEDELCSQLLHAACSDMASQLFLKVREERNLAYFVSSHRLLSLSTGQFGFYAGTHPDHAQEVLEAFQDEAERLRTEGLGRAEFERARTRLKGRNRMSLQSPGARAARAGMNVLYGRPVNDWETYDERLDALDPVTVRDFAAEHFRPEHAVSLIVGPNANVIP